MTNDSTDRLKISNSNGKKCESQNEWLNSEQWSFSGREIFKMSQFLELKTSSSLTPYYFYRAQEICSTSHLSIASRPAAGNTCVSMTKMRKMNPKTHQNDRFQVDFLKFFRKPQGGLYGCSMMYFDVLELWEPSWNDSGSTLDHSFFYDFSQNFGLNKSTLNAASTWPEWIDLSVCSVIPN